MPDQATQLAVTTRRYIDTNPELRDLVFNEDPTMSLIGETCHEEVLGGLNWNDNIIYDVQDGGPYLKGQDLPATQRQIEQAFQFTPKFNTIMLPFYKEDLKVFNIGPLAVVNLVESRVDEAFIQLGAQAALMRYLQGQTGAYVGFPSGLLEISSNGVDPGWDGTTYPVYGTLTRSLLGGRALAPKPYNFAGGAITLPLMEQIYQSVNYGSGKYECNVITTTANGYGYIRSNYQTQQRFQNVKVGKAGFTGLEYNAATILQSRYAPGSYLMNPKNGVAPVAPPSPTNGTNDIVAVRMFEFASGGALTGYPAPSQMFGNGAGGGSSVFGETIWFENIRKPMIKYRTSATKPYNGSLDDDGFIPSATSTKLVGKVLLAHNFTAIPGYFAYGFNFQT